MESFIFALVAFAHFSTALPQLRVPGHNGSAVRSLAVSQCRSVALRLLPPPSMTNYSECFKSKMSAASSHDWSVPGAEVAAQLDCWCQHNLTGTMQEYGCCEHDDVYPMCSVSCTPDCSSPLAQECVQNCPSMCFEAAEYVVNASLCQSCNWVKCWPVLGCLTKHARQRVQSGNLARTCHESDFRAKPELKEYWKCWKYAPKHSSHWNVLSSIVNCICREGMQEATRNSSCCDSMLYGGGTCDLECRTEAECVSQAAQTCIHSCQKWCPALQIAPSTECMQKCLSTDAPCRKYVSCRPASRSNFVCDDGRWPQAHSGCCIDNSTRLVGCPLLCESSRIWRLDRAEGIPWWARWHSGRGIIAQCTCSGCPTTSLDGRNKLKSAVEDGVWDNGQIMLVDIARRENLKYGPNRKMQELMAQRNEMILALIRESSTGTNLDRRIAEINSMYSRQITIAARTEPDRPHKVKYNDRENAGLVIAVIVLSSMLVCGIVFGTWCILFRRRPTMTPIVQLQGPEVVVGQPVGGGRHDDPFSDTAMGTPVTAATTVSAPTKGAKAIDLS